MLESTMIKYNNRSVETTQIIMELIELAKDINEAQKRGDDSGLSDDEIAFYDALAQSKSAKEVMGDKALMAIAREITRMIRNSVTVDWSLRESVQAKMRINIKRLLRKFGYPPDQQVMAINIVMEQAELMCGNETEYLGG
jgi:type I restriction enzyme R subunit